MSTRLDDSLNAYIDGELAPKAVRALEKRLAEPAVARRLESLRGLRQGLASARPRLSAADSQRLWVGIRARVVAQPETVVLPAWRERLFTRRWAPAWGLGVAAGLALWLALLRPASPPALAPALDQAVMAPMAKAPTRPGTASIRVAAAKGHAHAAPAPAAEQGPSVVEQALAADPVDDMIDRALQAPSPALRGGSLAAFDQVSVAPPAAAGAQPATPAQGGPDAHGFWDWKAAAMAMNQRQWAQVQVELKAADERAGSAGERAFAASALGLLAGVGGPLEGVESPLAPTGDLRIMGAGRWQLLVDARQARFVQGVSARLPGLRVEGSAAQMDLAFDRASFSPGTRFTRLSGEGSTKVLDAAEHPVTADEFTAPAGADYNVAEHVLRLR